VCEIDCVQGAVVIKLISADSLRKTGLLADEAGDLGNLKFGEPGVRKRNAVMAGWDERDRTPNGGIKIRCHHGLHSPNGLIFQHKCKVA